MINFTKMHGLGNDFVVIDNIKDNIKLSQAQIKTLADRNFGIGFDQLLMVVASVTADFGYLIYNADGVEVEQCGNGARCFARFVRDKGLSDKNPITVETCAGILRLFINADDSVLVDMGLPIFVPDKIPFVAKKQALRYSIEGYEAGVLSIGNPHCVIIVDEIKTINLVQIGSAIQNSPLFPNGVNVGLVQIHSRNKISLRVYERGVGETLACGSGACAAVVFGVYAGVLDNTTEVHLNGGNAIVEYHKGKSVFLSGAAEFVFEGQIQI